MADEVTRLFTPRPGVKYYALALNPRGVERMTGWKDKLTIRPEGRTSIWASDEFSRHNNNRTQVEMVQMLSIQVQAAKERGAAIPASFHRLCRFSLIRSRSRNGFRP